MVGDVNQSNVGILKGDELIFISFLYNKRNEFDIWEILMSRKKKLKEKLKEKLKMSKEESKQFMILSDALRGDYGHYKGSYLKVRGEYVSGTKGYSDIVPVFDVIYDHVVSHKEGTFCGLVSFNVVGGYAKCIKCKCGKEWTVHGPLYVQVSSAIEDFVCRMNENFDPEEYTYGAYKSIVVRKKQSYDITQKALKLKKIDEEKIEKRQNESHNPISSLEI